MPKLFKFICVGFMSIFIVSFGSSIYAKKGGGLGMGKENIMKETKNIRKEHELFKSKAKNNFYKSQAKKLKNKFSDKDRETISSFFSTHPINTMELPPGIAMNLARGKPLPPGIEKAFLPKELSDLLGVYPDYDYLMAGRDVLLVNRSNQVIVDILHNILR